MKKIVIVILILVLFAGIFIFRNIFNDRIPQRDMVKEMVVSSSVFQNGEEIPKRYSCQGEDINPPLSFEGIPENAKSLVLIVDDPDAPSGTWTHWVVFDIAPSVKELSENSVPSGAKQGLNSWGNSKYQGPCPPSGVHRYFFKVYALSDVLNLEEGSSREKIEESMNDKILAYGELVGTYSKNI